MLNKIQGAVNQHLEESKNYFPEDKIFGIFLQGSQNYELDTPKSDVDTKLLIVPSLRELALNKQPISTTLVRENNEHFDFKDIRLMIQTFRKQNINFLECLFTKYYIVNKDYEDIYYELVSKREEIARYCPTQAVKSMCGQVKQKRKYLCNDSEGRHENISKFGYDPKELHHIMRFEEFLCRYISGEPFETCLIPKNKEYLKEVKLGKHSLEDAVKLADLHVQKVEELTDEFLSQNEIKINANVDEFLDYVQEKIITRALRKELDEII